MYKPLDDTTFNTLLKDNMRIMVGGFMTCGTPEKLIDLVVKSNVQNLTIICNDAGYENQGVGKLIKNNQVKKLIASHIGLNPYAGKLMSEGLLVVDLVPQGTLAEKIRAHGAGLGGVLTPTGFHTIVEEGKKTITLDDKHYLLETALGANLALVEADTVDNYGNLTYAKTARNFNPVMATAATTVCVYAHKSIPTHDPECVVTPHIFVDYVMEGM